MSAPSLEATFAIATPAAVLLASLVGSGHCAAMCGPIALGLGTSRARIVAYNLGRLLSYAAVGAVAGGMMDRIGDSSSGPRFWFSIAALAAMAASLFATGANVWRGRSLHFRIAPLEKIAAVAWRILRLPRLPRAMAAFLGGAFSSLLPCGHLYGFAAAAAATGGAIPGAVLMAAFWLGTVPAVGLAVFGLRQALSAKLSTGQRASPRWAGALLIAAGLLSVGAFASRLHDARVAEAPAAAALKGQRCH